MYTCDLVDKHFRPIYDITLDDDGILCSCDPLLKLSYCRILSEVKAKVSGTEGVRGCDLKLTFNPPWDKNMLSDEAKLELGFL